MSGDTLGNTQEDGTPSPGGSPRQPYLFRVFDSGRPLTAQARYCLANVDVVAIGRGAGLARRTGRTLHVPLSDPRVSSKHAQLRMLLGRWIVEDAGSRNGVIRNGERVTNATLVDGDLIELGHSFFIYRAGLVAPTGLPADLEAVAGEAGLVTLLPELAGEFRRLADIARSVISVVILGETGTGKELVAHAVHAISSRTGTFVAVNCGALPESLIETELFGYRKGAFSGATDDRPGLVRSADRGTLFLDEIGDLPLASQAALLRVLQEREVTPVGSTRPMAVDFRLCAATHHTLDTLVSAGRFRADLLARISGFTIRLPPLRERREDTGLVVSTVLRRGPTRGEQVSFTKEVVRALFRYRWPLNIRELEKLVETAVVLAGGQPIGIEHFPETTLVGDSRPDEPASVLTPDDQRKRDELAALLAEHRGNISAVSRALGKERVQIRRWLRRYNLDPDAFKTIRR